MTKTPAGVSRELLRGIIIEIIQGVCGILSERLLKTIPETIPFGFHLELLHESLKESTEE